MIGEYRHVVTVQAPSGMVPDGEGGYTEGWTDLDPAKWDVSINPATARDLERVAAGTVITTATHIITGRYRSDVDTGTRVLFKGRIFHLTGVRNPEERNITLECTADEQL
jgi:SPP1 family predicted phage head-tail adaptor